ncbi:hypothetical protein E8E11_009035 [Didymella keratinophila]|nr:hypothetical protein E8E11_009035 [Didymella keratinophila]
MTNVTMPESMHDSGIAAWCMTETTFPAVCYRFGGQGDVPGCTRYVPVDCVYRDPSHTKSYASVELSTAGAVNIPISSLVSQYGDGTCGSFIAARGDTLSTMGDLFHSYSISSFYNNITSTLDKMQARGHLKAGTIGDCKPFSYKALNVTY